MSALYRGNFGIPSGSGRGPRWWMWAIAILIVWVIPLLLWLL